MCNVRYEKEVLERPLRIYKVASVAHVGYEKAYFSEYRPFSRSNWVYWTKEGVVKEDQYGEFVQYPVGGEVESKEGPGIQGFSTLLQAKRYMDMLYYGCDTVAILELEVPAGAWIRRGSPTWPEDMEVVAAEKVKVLGPSVNLNL